MEPTPHAEYYYVKPTDVEGGRLWLVGQEWRHLQVVQRARLGHRFFAVDGEGHCYECELVRAEQGRGEARILARRTGVGEPRLFLTIAASPLRGQRFDLLVEKCTELGVKRIVPVCTTRTTRDGGTRVERWRRVALAAMKQCGRSVLPEVTTPAAFGDVLQQAPVAAARFIAHEGARALPVVRVLKDFDRNAFREAVVLVGPEGGFTEEEVDAAVSKGFIAVSLGARRLRTETAAIAAATLMLGLFD